MNRLFILSACLLIIVISSSPTGFAETNADADSEPSPLKGLKRHFIGQFSACGPQPAREISFDPKISKLISRKLQEDEDAPAEVIRVIETKIDNRTNVKYFVDFDDGPSCDPRFTIIPSGQKTSAGSIRADHIIIPGNGFIYSTARSDEMFTVRRKYAVKGGKIVEVPQPVLSVGLESKAVREIKIRSKKDGGEIVATIPKAGKLTVLINDGDYYLLKTPFGLVGWAKFDTASQDASDVEGIFFMGD